MELDRGGWWGKQSGAVCLLKVAGRHRGDVEEAEVPASKSDRASREFLDL